MRGTTGLLSRRVLILFLLVVGFTTAQFCWWVVFNVGHSEEQLATLKQQAERDRRLASEVIMMQAQSPGYSPERVRRLLEQYFPYLEWRSGVGVGSPAGASGVSHGVVVKQRVLDEMEQKHASRVRMFLWEGGFFLFTLMVGVALILRTMRREVHLRRQQANFLSAVTHELKSPLASIRLYTETMQMRDPPTEKRQRYLRNIRQDVDRLETLVGNVLAVSRLEAHRFDMRPEQRDLATDVESIVAPFAHELEERGGEFTLDVGDERVVAHYDTSALHTVLRNLLDNALKYGGAEKRVAVRVRRHGSEAILEVQDWGIGLRKGDCRRIFEKFYRVGDEMVRQTEGSGLGLYLVRELIRQGGGDVSARSAGPGTGSMFRVALPMSSVGSNEAPMEGA